MTNEPVSSTPPTLSSSVTVTPTATRLIATGPVEVRFGYNQSAQRTVTFGPRTHGHRDLTVNGIPVSINVRFHEAPERSWDRNYSRHDVRRYEPGASSMTEPSPAARNKIYTTLLALVPGLAEANPHRFDQAVVDHAATATWAERAQTLRDCAAVAEDYNDLHDLVTSGAARLAPGPLPTNRRARSREAEPSYQRRPNLKRCNLTAAVVTSDTHVVIGYAVCSDRNQLELVPANHVKFDNDETGQAQ